MADAFERAIAKSDRIIELCEKLFVELRRGQSMVAATTEELVGRGGHPAGRELNDRKAAERLGLHDQVVGGGDALGVGEDPVVVHATEGADVAHDGVHEVDGLHDVAGARLALGAGHGGVLANAAEGLAKVAATAHEGDAEAVLADVVGVVGKGKDLALIDVVHADDLQDLGLHEVDDAMPVTVLRGYGAVDDDGGGDVRAVDMVSEPRLPLHALVVSPGRELDEVFEQKNEIAKAVGKELANAMVISIELFNRDFLVRFAPTALNSKDGVFWFLVWMSYLPPVPPHPPDPFLSSVKVSQSGARQVFDEVPVKEIWSRWKQRRSDVNSVFAKAMSDVEETGEDENAQLISREHIQGLPWERMSITRDRYRQTRLEQHENFENIRNSGRTSEKLRNLVWATTRHDVYLMSYYSVLHWSPLTCKKREVLDLQGHVAPCEKHQRKFSEGFYQTQVSTLAVKNNLLVAGGFHGERICKFLDCGGISYSCKSTHDDNGITNSLEIFEKPSGSVHFLASNSELCNHLHPAETSQLDGKIPWEDEAYLKPFMEDDSLLHSLSIFDDDEEEEEDCGMPMEREECSTGNGSLAEPCENHLKTTIDDGSDVSTRFEQALDIEGTSGESIESLAQRLKVARVSIAAKKIKSVDDNYFGSYSSFGIHREMLADKVRTDTYRDALLGNPSLRNGATVLDVGCGTGILSLFAAKAGASRVIAVDGSAKMVFVATQVAKNNDLLYDETMDMEQKQSPQVISVVHTKAEELNHKIQVPPNGFDVLGSEWMGYCPLYESMLSSVLHVRDHFLKTGDAILPDTATILGAGFGKEIKEAGDGSNKRTFETFLNPAVFSNFK